jgi:hypothetical protein
MEAMYFCNAHGMDLVTIETQNENDLIMEHIASLGEWQQVSAFGTGINKKKNIQFGNNRRLQKWKKSRPPLLVGSGNATI